MNDGAGCPSAETLSEFVSSGLTDEEFDAVEEHVSSCPKCGEWLVTLDDEPLPVSVESAPKAESQSDFEASDDSNESSDSTEVCADAVPGQAGDYDVLEAVGRGGMGSIYRGRHRELNRIVALKFLPAERFSNPQARERFDREMKAAGHCDHPNIVRTYDARKLDTCHFIAMEYVDGRDAASLVVEHQRMKVADACAVAAEVAVALEYIHERQLVHRDVKPSNIMISSRGEVKLLDLGLTRFNVEEHVPPEIADAGPVAEIMVSGNPTLDSSILGTIGYMSPEQWDSPPDIDIRADIYSLGCTLYQMLTGCPPFYGAEYQTAWRICRAHHEIPVRPTTNLRDDVPATVEAILQKALAKSADDRFATPLEMANALAPFTESSQLAKLIDSSAEQEELSVTRLLSANIDSARPRQRRAARLRFFAGLATAGFGLVVLSGLFIWRIAVGPPQYRLRLDEAGILHVDWIGSHGRSHLQIVLLKSAHRGVDADDSRESTVRLTSSDGSLVSVDIPEYLARSQVTLSGVKGIVVSGGTGDDFIEANVPCPVTLLGGQGRDTLKGGEAADSLDGQAGSDNLNGHGGMDILRGGDNSDTLIGCTGSDRIYGGGGNDTCIGNGSSDWVYGGSGNDQIDGDRGRDYLFGGTGSDTLEGEDQVDFLFGMADPDKLDGGAESDYIVDVTAQDQARPAESAERHTALGPISEEWFESWVDLDPLEPLPLPFDLKRDLSGR